MHAASKARAWLRPGPQEAVLNRRQGHCHTRVRPLRAFGSTALGSEGKETVPREDSRGARKGQRSRGRGGRSLGGL